VGHERQGFGRYGALLGTFNRAWLIAETILGGVSGTSVIRAPKGRRASSMAFAKVAGGGIVPPSPAPLTPSEFRGLGEYTWWSSTGGTSEEEGRE